jgi:hypothetical protein
MILVGLTGPIGHGKTVLAEALGKLEPKSSHIETNLVISEVANGMHQALTQLPDPYNVESLNMWLEHLPRILKETVHVFCAFEQIKLIGDEVVTHPVEYQKLIMHVENLRRDPNLAKQTITQENKEVYRPFLQWLGGYLVQKVDTGIWFNEIVSRVHVFEHEGAELVTVGGLRFPKDGIILREAGGVVIKIYRPDHLQYDSLDPTERERSSLQIDSTVINNGTLEDIDVCAAKILADLRGGNLQASYHTSRGPVEKQPTAPAETLEEH